MRGYASVHPWSRMSKARLQPSAAMHFAEQSTGNRYDNMRRRKMRKGTMQRRIPKGRAIISPIEVKELPVMPRAPANTQGVSRR
jgi:hypothetical protein